MIAALLAVLLAAAGPLPAAAARRPPPAGGTMRRTISLAVVAPPAVSDSLVARIVAEAQAIWAAVGVRLDWVRYTSSEEGSPCDVVVTIENRRRGETGLDVALGWITFSDGAPEPSIHLSQGGAEALMKMTPVPQGTLATQETLISRALGRALAHEIGHYVSGSKAHSGNGLMRAVRRSEDFFSTDGRGFEMIVDGWRQ